MSFRDFYCILHNTFHVFEDAWKLFKGGRYTENKSLLNSLLGTEPKYSFFQSWLLTPSFGDKYFTNGMIALLYGFCSFIMFKAYKYYDLQSAI